MSAIVTEEVGSGVDVGITGIGSSNTAVIASGSLKASDSLNSDIGGTELIVSAGGGDEGTAIHPDVRIIPVIMVRMIIPVCITSLFRSRIV